MTTDHADRSKPTNLASRVLLFLKGACMGMADIIPGVSGGTMALILGVYRELVDSIRGLNLRWVPPLWRWLSGGRQDSDWRAFRAEFATLNLPFLINLGVGIVVALGVGSAIIPTLMERYPEEMRAFFFGLIVASVWVPFKMIDLREKTVLGLVVAWGLAGLAFGFVVTDPGNTFETTRTWETVTSEGESLEHLARRGPSAETTESIYWSDKNNALRQAVARQAPAEAAELERLHAEMAGVVATDKSSLKARSEPYNELQVPAGTPVQVPQPAYWYVFIAGAVAICAMILPGISGSYILLILGAYFFILNALKGFIKTLLGGAIPTSQAAYVVLFCAGAGIGLLSFARLLSYLLERFPAYTLAGLVGLMLGCLRGIWPFRAIDNGVPVNAMPAEFNAAVGATLATFVLGFVLVALLTWAGSAYGHDEGASS